MFAARCSRSRVGCVTHSNGIPWIVGEMWSSHGSAGRSEAPRDPAAWPRHPQTPNTVDQPLSAHLLTAEQGSNLEGASASGGPGILYLKAGCDTIDRDITGQLRGAHFRLK